MESTTSRTSLTKFAGPEKRESALPLHRGSWIRERPAESNPFAFIPKDLSQLHDPKDLNALRAIGGVQGLLLGLRTNAEEGLSPNEYVLRGKVTFEEISSAANNPGRGEEIEADLVQRNESSGQSGGILHTSTLRRISTMSLGPAPHPFQDRTRIFSANRLPRKRSKNLFQLMWLILQDKVLVQPICSLLIRLYYVSLPWFRSHLVSIKAFDLGRRIKSSGWRALQFW